VTVISGVANSDTVKHFSIGRVSSVLIIGYERMRTVIGELKGCAFDLVVCDEAHRLKNQNAATSCAINELRPRMRLALTGYVLFI
jgi:DNA repair and recombination protein RAD54B